MSDRATHAWGALTLGGGLLLGIPSTVSAVTKAGASPLWWQTPGFVTAGLLLLIGAVLLVLSVLHRAPRSDNDLYRSTTFEGGSITGQSRLEIDSSADRLTHGTDISGNTRFRARHSPASRSLRRSRW